MKNLLKYILISTLLFCSTAVYAQQWQNQERVEKLRYEMEQTDQFIDRAKEAVRISDSPKAQIALEQAINLQTNAWGRFRQGNVGGYTEAAILTASARQKAKYAIANGQFNEQNDDAVLRKLETTQEILRQLKEKIQGKNYPQMQQLIETANNNLTRAWEFYRDGQFRPAFKMCMQIQNTLRRLRQQVGNFQGNYERFHQNVVNKLETFNENNQDCESEQATQFAAQADQALKQAEEFNRQKRYEAAVKALQNSNNLVKKAIRHCFGENNLDRELQQLRLEADRINELLPVADANVKALMEQFNSQYKLARSFLDEGDVNSATAATRASQLLLDQIVKLVNTR